MDISLAIKTVCYPAPDLFLFVDDSTVGHTVPYPTERQTAALSLLASMELIRFWFDK